MPPDPLGAPPSQLPQGLGPVATGVGSLPHTDVRSAIDLVVQHMPVLPHWPQLPRRGPEEGMLRQVLAVPADLLVDDRAGLAVADGAAADVSAALAAPAAGSAPPGLVALVDALADGRLPAAAAVKGQVAGPITTGRYVADPTAAPDVAAELRRALVARVTASAVDQVRTLRGTGLPVLLVVDEPAPGPWSPEESADLAAVVEAVAAAGATPGLHRCAVPPPTWEGGSDARVLRSLDLIAAAPPPADVRAWAEGAWLAAGLLPTLGALPGSTAVQRRWAQLADAAGPAGPWVDLAARTVITPACGLAGGTEDGASATAAAAAAAAAEIAVAAGIPTGRGRPAPPVDGPRGTDAGR